MATIKPPRPGNRREFVRTSVPAVERLSGAVILLLLAGIGVPLPSRAGIITLTCTTFGRIP